MIEFERTNEKGDKVKAYTHQSFLSSQYTSEIARLSKRYQTWSDVALYGTTIVTYWALHKSSTLHQFVQTKLPWKGKFLIASAAVGLVDSFLVSVILSSSLRNTRETLLKKEVFPAWLQRDRVVNPDRIFFELDDNNHNEPTIWHSSINQTNVERIIPDFVVGTPQNPHFPVAEQHHH